MVESAEMTNTRDMVWVHSALRREFTRMPGLVESAANGTDAQRWPAVYDHWLLMSLFLAEHHGGEDQSLWPKLTERLPDQLDLIESMEAQHERIHDLLTRANAQFAAWGPDAAPTHEESEALVNDLNDLNAALDEHLAAEESQILPLVPGVITPPEWAELAANAQAALPGDKLFVVFGLILQDLSPDDQAAMLSVLPPPVIDLWNSAGKSQYEKYVARLA